MKQSQHHLKDNHGYGPLADLSMTSEYKTRLEEAKKQALKEDLTPEADENNKNENNKKDFQTKENNEKLTVDKSQITDTDQSNRDNGPKELEKYKPYHKYYEECKRKHENGQVEIIDRETYLKRIAEQKAKQNPKIEQTKPKMTKKQFLLKLIGKIAPNIQVKDKIEEQEDGIYPND